MVTALVVVGLMAFTGLIGYAIGYAQGVAEQYDHTFMKRRRDDFSAPRNGHA